MVATTNRRTGYGLLPTPTVSPYPGLLAPTKDQRREAFFTGLGNVGKSMNGGYSDRPISFMNQLNKGMGGFQEGYQGELETNRAKEMQNMQAQQQQAQMQAQQMAIAEAQRKQAQLAAQQEAAKAYFGSQGAYAPNMVDGMEQTTDLGNVAGAIKLNPLEQIQVDSGSGFDVIKNRQDIAASNAAEARKNKNTLEIERAKAGYKQDTPLIKNLKGMGLVPGTLPFNEALKQGLLKNPNFDPNLGMKTAAMDEYKTATSQLTEADRTLENTKQMLDLVNSGVNTGSLAEAKLGLKKLLLASGITDMDADLDAIADAETMSSKGMDFILQRIAKTKGAISEKEMKAFEKASPGLKNTPEGNRRILALVNKIADRQKFEAEAVRKAYSNNPNISIVGLDDARIAARKKFGSMVIPEVTATRVIINNKGEEVAQ